MRLGRSIGLAVALICLAAAPARAVTITEFESNPGHVVQSPKHIVSGPEGNIWWTEASFDFGIMRMSPSGERLPIIKTKEEPFDLVVAPSGWASWTTVGGYGARGPGGGMTEQATGYPGGAIALTPSNEIRYGRNESNNGVICRGPNDNLAQGSLTCGGFFSTGQVTGLAASTQALWASFAGVNQVRILDTATPKAVDLPAASGPAGIAIGPEGSAWVAMTEAGAIDRIGPDGTRTRFPLSAGSEPENIALGPDGALWITEFGIEKIGRMTTAGALTNEYPVPSHGGEAAEVGDITAGPDGALWFTEGVGKIARLVPDPPTGPAPPGPAADTAAPKFTGKPSFSPSRFRVAGKARASVLRKGAAPTGTKLKFSLTEAAKVTATIARRAPGRKSGRKCVTSGKAKPGAAKCNRFVKVGPWSANGSQGANKVPFNGKLKGRALAPGAYRATLTARDGAGNVSAARTASFTIVR